MLASDFEERSAAGVGWDDVGDLTSVTTVEAILKLVRDAYPQARPGWHITSAHQLHKFRNVMDVGHRVVTYDPGNRRYVLGTVDGPYQYSTDVLPACAHIRKVAWQKHVWRDLLTTGTRNTLGSTLAIFEPGDAVLNELDDVARRNAPPETPVEEAAAAEEQAEELGDLRRDTIDRAHEFIKDRLLRLLPDDMERLVACLLRALGYRATVTPKGRDRGRDVVASPDGLGFESPRIFAEVKHRTKSIGAPEVRAFIGGLRNGDRGLYVSTGGFSQEAKYEAERASVPVTLVNLDDLASLVVEHYDRFEPEGRTLIPLTRIYWPVT